MFHKRLLKEFSDNRKYVAGMVAGQWAALLANAALMMAVSALVGTVLEGGEIKYGLIRLVAIFAAALTVRSIAATVVGRLSFAASACVKRRLRELIYAKLMRMGTSYRDTMATSEAVQISAEGVDQLEIYFGKYVPQFFYSILAPLTLFVIVGTMSLKVAAVLLLCVPLIPASIIGVQKFAKKLLAKYWGTYTELGDSFLENLQGLTTLKIYQADERYAKKMDEEAERFRKVTMRVLIMQLNSISIMDLAAFGGAALGMILAVFELRAGAMSLPECFFIIMISAEFFLPLRLLGSFFHIAMNGNAAADKIFRLLDSPEPQRGNQVKIDGSSIRFSDVNFGYTEEKQILKDVSFEIPERHFVAFVGESGCGKSTVTSLMMGDFSVKGQGRVSIGGVDISKLSSGAVYQKITRVRHDSYLFAGTVMDNLRMGKENIEYAEALEVLKRVDLLDTIMEKGGLDMKIKEKASNLSGGQKQRLVLARALLYDSDIYIFDEATSNIDVESENKIMKVIHELAQEKTVILISHRLANVVKADQILVMKSGRIVEMGSHQKLIEQKGYYHSLFSVQRELESYAEEAS